MRSTALVICGALGAEVKDIVDRRGWDVDVYGVSALLHLYPGRIVEQVQERLRALRPRYERLVVVYGDCGTAGRLEPVLDELGAARLRGPHCYEMYTGADEFERLARERPGTFFLTDWLVRNFDRAVVRGLGLDRHPDLLLPVAAQAYWIFVRASVAEYLADWLVDAMREYRALWRA